MIMKKLLGLLALTMLCVSCSVQRSTSTYRTMNQKSFHEAPLIADLEVGEKIEYTFIPTKTMRRRLSNAALKENAVAAALEANGNADVLLHPQYKTVTSATRKCKKIVVTGFPAKYVKFREPSVEELDKIIMLNNGSYIHMNKKANRKAK